MSDERFIKMSHDYELEQSNLKAMAEVLREEIKQQEKQKTNVKAFISAVKKYTDMQQLDAAMLREFIDRIEVSHTDKNPRRGKSRLYTTSSVHLILNGRKKSPKYNGKTAKNGIAVWLHRSLLKCFLNSPPHYGSCFFVFFC